MKRALALGLVLAQLLLLAALFLLPHGSLWPVNATLLSAAVALGVVGAILAVVGVVSLGPAMTASPIPRGNAPLVTGGVYGLVRNPVYTGLMTGGLGPVLFGASVWHIAAWVTLLVLLSAKARWEERMLAVAHPDYRGYGARVGRFLPGVGRMRPPESPTR